MASPLQAPQTPSRRRWLRFSLRTTLVLVTFYCVWLAFVTFQARRQQKALNRVEELHGLVAFSYELDPEGRDWITNPQPFVPTWIRNRVGEDYFRCVAIVNFDEGSDPTNDDLEVIHFLPHLRQLTFANRKKVSDAGLAHLAGLKQLKVLVLDGTSVTGPGLAHLRGLGQLELLTLSSTPLTNDGLEHLAALTNLKTLIVSDTKISDDALRHIARVPWLESLQLVNTEITDAGLAHLESLRTLKSILLRGTKITREGRAALQNALPLCRVPIEPPTQQGG